MWFSLVILVLPIAALATPRPVVNPSTRDFRSPGRSGKRKSYPARNQRRLPFADTSYAPYAVSCPTDVTWIRPATGLSAGEEAFLAERGQYLTAPINAMLASHGLTQPPRTPVISFALSGGGYRAMNVGLGMVMATMNASAEAASSGVGGWFEGVTYMAGLSGGSWGTGTFMANGGPLPLDLITSVWNLDSNLVIPSDDKTEFYYDLESEVDAKGDEGFPTQVTDYWGLALSEHLFPDPYRATTMPNLTFSQLPSIVSALGNASLPMPIIVAAEREQGEIVIAENATVWEFTPYEFGSWAVGSGSKVLGAFTPLEYLGTSLNNGQANSTCYKGFDQLCYVLGSSSTLFNAEFLALNATNSSSIITDAIEAILGEIGEDQYDVSRVPNSFANWNAQPNPISDLEYITLVDAGETNQNVPLEPLLIPSRNVDAILAFDSSADTTYSWPNGTALYTTYNRAKILAQSQNVSIRMPAVPSVNGFVNGGLNQRPTFFGCDDTTTPLIIYVPNYPWSYYGNTSTYMLQYDNATAEAVMLNGMRSLTLNGSVPTWPGCLACALSDRAFNYTSLNRSSECQSCFDTWCWNGSDNTTMPVEYEPVLGIAPSFLNITGGSSMTTATTNATTSVAPSKGAAGSVRVKLAGAWWSGMGLAVCMGLGVMMIFI